MWNGVTEESVLQKKKKKKTDWICSFPSVQENKEVCLCRAANSLLFPLWIIAIERFPEKTFQTSVEKLLS